MKYFLALVSIASAFFLPQVHAQEAGSVDKAQAAAIAWLALTDAGEYSKSWDQAAGLFQAAISKTDWQKALQGARTPMGALKSRKLLSATYTRSLPGAPEGEYVVIQYETQFERMPKATETVTPLRDKDGRWKVSGYYIK